MFDRQYPARAARRLVAPGSPSGRPTLFAGAFVLAICMSILGIEGWRIASARNAQIAESETAATNLAKSLAEQASGTLIQADLVLSNIVERLEADGTSAPNVDRIHRVLEAETAHLPQLQRLSVFDASGRPITTSQSEVRHEVGHADREYFRFHQGHADAVPHVGPPIRSRTDGQWILTISRRFDRADGTFGGVVLASIDLAFFDNYYRQFDIGRSGSIVLAMNDGTILDRRPVVENLIGTSLADGSLFKTHIAFDEVGTTWITSRIDGIERLTAYQKVDLFPAYAIVSLSREEMLAEWAENSIVHGAAAALLVLIIAFVGYRLVAQIAQRHADQVELIASQSALQVLNAKLDGLAREDGLTGLANRREFDHVLHNEVQRVARSGEPLALVMLDIDRFKAYNDFFGHPQGDECIRAVARQVQASANRPGDLAARYGGEEFVILLPSTDAKGALCVANSVRDAIRRLALPAPPGPRQHVTVSMGVGVVRGDGRAGTMDSLLVQADKALYAAKQAGRDAIRVFDSPVKSSTAVAEPEEAALASLF